MNSCMSGDSGSSARSSSSRVARPPSEALQIPTKYHLQCKGREGYAAKHNEKMNPSWHTWPSQSRTHGETNSILRERNSARERERAFTRTRLRCSASCTADGVMAEHSGGAQVHILTLFEALVIVGYRCRLRQIAVKQRRKRAMMEKNRPEKKKKGKKNCENCLNFAVHPPPVIKEPLATSACA